MIRNVQRIPAAVAAAIVTLVMPLGLVSVAQAYDYEQVESREVHYSDLDLSREADAKKLYRRIERAARRVCSRNVGRYSHLTNVASRCMGHSIREAVAQVNHANLTAVHAARSDGRLSVAARR